VIPFAIGTLVGAGCVVVWSELYTRWLYKDVKKMARKQGVSEQQMRDALIWETAKEIDINLGK
jgi:hypothetical protein